MKTKPFDLSRALAGDPVVTRDGRKVFSVVAHTSTLTKFPVSAVVDGICCAVTESYTSEGKYVTGGAENPEDLLMAPNTVWLNMYKDNDETFHGYIYKTKEQADKGAGVDRVACVETDAF